MGSAAVSAVPLSKLGDGTAPVAAGGRDEGEADSKRLSEKARFSRVGDRVRVRVSVKGFFQHRDKG